MTEFSGYCTKCKHQEDVFANKPCEKCGAKMVITHMDGMTESDINRDYDELWDETCTGDWEDG